MLSTLPKLKLKLSSSLLNLIKPIEGITYRSYVSSLAQGLGLLKTCRLAWLPEPGILKDKQTPRRVLTGANHHDLCLCGPSPPSGQYAARSPLVLRAALSQHSYSPPSAPPVPPHRHGVQDATWIIQTPAMAAVPLAPPHRARRLRHLCHLPAGRAVTGQGVHILRVLLHFGAGRWHG